MAIHQDDTKHPSRRHESLLPQIRLTREERARLVLVIVAGLVLYWLFTNSFDALGPFIFALVLAYLMLPLVDLLDRYMPRVLAIMTVYLVFIVSVAAFLAWLVPAIATQVQLLVDQAPSYTTRAQEWTKNITDWYNSLPISSDVRQSIENSIRNSTSAIGNALQQGVVGTLTFVSRTMGVVVGLVIIPFWLFYVLKDRDRGIEAFNNMLPRTWRGDIWRIIRIINGILSSYIRGQLLLGLAVGVATFIGMLIVGAPYAVILGIVSGLTEVIPIVGPVIGAVPGLILAAFSGDIWLVLKVLLVYAVVQQLENNLLVPKIQGDSVKLHPAIIMVSIVVGSQVAGLVGLIVAVPVAAILRDIYLYLYRRFGEDYTPREAEASVPSRQDEETPQSQEQIAKELALKKQEPGINSADEMIEELDGTSEQEDAASTRR